MAATVKIEITADDPHSALAAARDIGAPRVLTEQVNCYPPNVQSHDSAPPLTDAELGKAQAIVAAHLQDALLTLAAIPDITNVEAITDREYLAGALYSLARAGEQAQLVLDQYDGDICTKIAGLDSPNAAATLKAAAQAARALHPNLFSVHEGGTEAPEAEVEPHSNS